MSEIPTYIPRLTFSLKGFYIFVDNVGWHIGAVIMLLPHSMMVLGLSLVTECMGFLSALWYRPMTQWHWD